MAPLGACNWQDHKEGFVDPSARAGTRGGLALSSPRPPITPFSGWDQDAFKSQQSRARGELRGPRGRGASEAAHKGVSAGSWRREERGSAWFKNRLRVHDVPAPLPCSAWNTVTLTGPLVPVSPGRCQSKNILQKKLSEGAGAARVAGSEGPLPCPSPAESSARSVFPLFLLWEPWFILQEPPHMRPPLSTPPLSTRAQLVPPSLVLWAPPHTDRRSR